MRAGIRSIVLMVALVCSGFVRAGDLPSGDELVRATLLNEYAAAEPGQTVQLGIRLEMEQGWHTYWKNSGDSGLPVHVSFGEADGLAFGDVRWPAPEWHLGSGDVLDYIYEGTVVLLVPMTIDESVSPGTTLDIECTLQWLVCKDVCLPGSAELQSSIRVNTQAAAGPDAELIGAAVDALPQEIGAGTSDVRLAWRGAVLEVRCPGADAITLFPGYSEETEAIGPVTLRSIEGDTLRVPFDPAPDQYLVVSGVVTVDRGRERDSYSFAIRGPEYK